MSQLRNLAANLWAKGATPGEIAHICTGAQALAPGAMAMMPLGPGWVAITRHPHGYLLGDWQLGRVA